MNEKARAIFILICFTGGAITAWREWRDSVTSDLWPLAFIAGALMTGLGIGVVVLTVVSIGVLLGLLG